MFGISCVYAKYCLKIDSVAEKFTVFGLFSLRRKYRLLISARSCRGYGWEFLRILAVRQLFTKYRMDLRAVVSASFRAAFVKLDPDEVENLRISTINLLGFNNNRFFDDEETCKPDS